VAKIDYSALKESVSDTAIATPLNLILNYIFLALFLSWEWGATEISFAMTAMFFMVAVVRKYYVRQWFKRRQAND
jgi:hypothetical protein